MAMRIFFWLVLLAAPAFLGGCTPETETATPVPATITPLPAPTITTTPVVEPPPLPFDLSNQVVVTPTISLTQQTVFGFTYQNPDGNRFVPGQGQMGHTAPIDIALVGRPIWLVAAPVDGGGSIWTAALEDGQTQSFMVRAGQVVPLALQPGRLPPGAPPLLMIFQGLPKLVTVPTEDASPFTHPVILDGDPANYAYVAQDGDLVVRKDRQTHRFPVNALPDARILQDENGRLLLLTGSTARYPHGVLGDRLEADSITLVGTDPPQILATIPAAGRVVEGIAPIWFDLDGDGAREIIATLADEVSGAQLVVFSEEGEYLAEGPAVGRGFRWRHLLAAAPFGPAGENYLVDNLTPHLDAVTEFMAWQGEMLVPISSVAGFSTHRLGSRNMDRALAGDLDGDGAIEILVPTQAGRGLIALNLINNSVIIGWRIQLNAEATTNIASARLNDESIAVGIGLENNTLRLWHP